MGPKEKKEKAMLRQQAIVDAAKNEQKKKQNLRICKEKLNSAKKN